MLARLLALVLLFSAGTLSARGQAARGPSAGRASSSDTTATPTPYTTNRSIGYHILKAPAYLVYGVTRPLGWAVRYVEREFPSLFEPTRPVRGVAPLIELGGPVGVIGGAALYDNDVFGSSHRARVQGVYGSRNFYEVQARYHVPDPVGPRSWLALSGALATTPRDRFFLGGRQSANPADEVEFFIRQITAGPQVAYTVGASMDVRHAVRYRYVDAKPADSRLGTRFANRAPGTPGLTTQHSVALQTEWRLDRRHRERSRYTSGTLVRLGGEYNHDVQGDQFRYGRYVAEVRQYVPVPGLPAGRRVVLRGRLHQAEPTLRGDAVPFYAQPTLGSAEGLRGFPPERFAGNGALIVNAEYRYPIWDLWDAVLFVDTGQVFAELEDVNVRLFEVSYGGGIHLLSRTGLSFRFEVAGSNEGVRITLTADRAFRSLF